MNTVFAQPIVRRVIIDRFVNDSAGEDLIEYGLLAALFGLVALGLMTNLGGAIEAAYSAWQSGVQALWQTPDPM